MHIQYLGEIISLGVAFSWTIAAMTCEVASKRIGVTVTNVWRMALALIFSLLMMWWFTGEAWPTHASATSWAWLMASGMVGYFLGDWCLFNSYISIGSRYGQLFMTLAPMFTAISAWAMLGQVMSVGSLIAMMVTMLGIAISVLSKGENKGRFLSLQLPVKGVLFGIGAGLGQGLGLVLSKIGLDNYTADIPQTMVADMESYLPFSANLIRCVAGLICWGVFLIVTGQGQKLRQSAHDTKALWALLIAVFSGPVIGVGFSLMAVQYTAAGIASTLMATSPIMILLPAHYFFHEKITLKGIVGAVISVVGVSLFFLI